MEIFSAVRDLNISFLSIAWAYLKDGWVGIAKVICEAITKLLQKADKDKLKKYSEVLAKVAVYIREGITIFIEDEELKKAGEMTAKAIEGLVNHISDGNYDADECMDDIDTIIACIDAWKDKFRNT